MLQYNNRFIRFLDNPSSAWIGAGGQVAGGALGFIGGLIQNYQQRKMMREQMAWNEKMREQENEWSLEQWNRENEYNSPVAAAQRLKDAGLHSAVYGLNGAGNASSLTSATTNSASMPQLTNPYEHLGAGIANSASTFADIKLKEYQALQEKTTSAYQNALRLTEDMTRMGKIELQNVNIELGKVDINMKEEQANLFAKEALQIENDMRLANERFALDFKKFEFEKYIKEVEIQLEAMKLSTEQYKVYHEIAVAYGELRVKQKQLLINRDLADSQINLNDSQIELNNNQADYYTALVKTEQYDLQFRIDNNDAIVAEMWAKVDEAEARAAYAEEQTEHYETQMWINGVAQVFGAIAGAVLGVTAAGKVGKGLKAARSARAANRAANSVPPSSINPQNPSLPLN